MWWYMLVVGAGGFIGANLRYLVSIWFGQRFFPWATLTVNILGCFGLAFLAVWLRGQVEVKEEIRLFIATGFFGALTTFSTFSLEILVLVEGGHWQTALLYLMVSLVMGIGGGAFGMGLANYLA